MAPSITSAATPTNINGRYKEPVGGGSPGGSAEALRLKLIREDDDKVLYLVQQFFKKGGALWA